MAVERLDRRTHILAYNPGFTKMLDEYMVWYRDKRIKLEYGMSIMGKRIELGLVA